MWVIDLSFLQESVEVFEKYFVDKIYKIYTCSGKIFLITNSIKNYPHLIGIRQPQLQRLHGSKFLVECIKNNDTSTWSKNMKKTFYHIYPNGKPVGLNDIKITFFPLMPELFIKDNYIISVNYDKTLSPTLRQFDTEVLISDFNDGMNIGMKQREDGTFRFNSWRVELNEEQIMKIYNSQEIDLIEKIEQYENNKLIYTKILSLSHKNLWRLSRLLRNYNASFLNSFYYDSILELSKFDDNEFDEAMKSISVDL